MANATKNDSKNVGLNVDMFRTFIARSYSCHEQDGKLSCSHAAVMTKIVSGVR